MNNRRLTSLVLIVCALLSAVARGEWPVVDVLAEGAGSTYWVCIVREDDTVHTGEKPASSSLRQRVDPVAGKWIEVAGLQARVVDIASVGDDLAVLTSGGDWKLIHGGQGVVEGAALPAPYRPVSFGSNGKQLYAIAVLGESAATTTSTTQPALTPSAFLWTGNGWKLLASLPENADPARVSIGGNHDVIHLVSERGDNIVIERLDGQTWKIVSEMPRAGVKRFKLLPNASGLHFARQDAKGAWSVISTGDDPNSAPKPLPEHLPSDVTIVGPTLRLVYLDDQKRITQLSIDNYGTGETLGPDVIAQVAPHPQAGSAWSTVMVLVLLVVTMLVTLRQRPGLPTDVPEATTLRLAPLGRRMAAGVIDVLPLLAAFFYTLRTANQSEAYYITTASSLFPYIGLLVWIGHTAICEAIYGRSFGKYLFGLRVVGYDGAPVPAGRIILRNLLRMLEFTLFGLPLLLLLFTPLRQRVGDLAARTVVISDDVPDAEDSEPTPEG